MAATAVTDVEAMAATVAEAAITVAGATAATAATTAAVAAVASALGLAAVAAAAAAAAVATMEEAIGAGLTACGHGARILIMAISPAHVSVTLANALPLTNRGRQRLNAPSAESLVSLRSRP
jgi:hypothetical protein